MTGYCLKCKESREMQEAEQVTMKNGRPVSSFPALAARWFE